MTEARAYLPASTAVVRQSYDYGEARESREHRWRVNDVLRDIKLPLGATFYLASRGGIVYFRIEQMAGDNLNPDSPAELQRGRPWIIRPGADTGEIIRSAWLAFKTYAEHEFREQFTYKGERPLYPHFTVD